MNNPTKLHFPPSRVSKKSSSHKINKLNDQLMKLQKENVELKIQNEVLKQENTLLKFEVQKLNKVRRTLYIRY